MACNKCIRSVHSIIFSAHRVTQQEHAVYFLLVKACANPSCARKKSNLCICFNVKSLTRIDACILYLCIFEKKTIRRLTGKFKSYIEQGVDHSKQSPNSF